MVLGLACTMGKESVTGLDLYYVQRGMPSVPTPPLSFEPSKPRVRPYAHVDRYKQPGESKIFEFLVVLVAHIPCIHALAFWRIVILIEAAGVCSMFDIWDNGSFCPPLIHRIPIYVLEVDVILDASSTVGKVP